MQALRRSVFCGEFSCDSEYEVLPVSVVVEEVMLGGVRDGMSRFVGYEFAQLELAHGFSSS